MAALLLLPTAMVGALRDAEICKTQVNCCYEEPSDLALPGFAPQAAASDSVDMDAAEAAARARGPGGEER